MIVGLAVVGFGVYLAFAYGNDWWPFRIGWSVDPEDLPAPPTKPTRGKSFVELYSDAWREAVRTYEPPGYRAQPKSADEILRESQWWDDKFGSPARA